MLVAQRWILACLRNRRFFSLEELNAAIGELLEKLNTQAVPEARGVPAVRLREAGPAGDEAVCPRGGMSLGSGSWRSGVNIDYHLEYDHRYYSAPCELMNAQGRRARDGDGGGGVARRRAGRVA